MRFRTGRCFDPVQSDGAALAESRSTTCIEDEIPLQEPQVGDETDPRVSERRDGYQDRLEPPVTCYMPCCSKRPARHVPPPLRFSRCASNWLDPLPRSRGGRLSHPSSAGTPRQRARNGACIRITGQKQAFQSCKTFQSLLLSSTAPPRRQAPPSRPNRDQQHPSVPPNHTNPGEIAYKALVHAIVIHRTHQKEPATIPPFISHPDCQSSRRRR